MNLDPSRLSFAAILHDLTGEPGAASFSDWFFRHEKALYQPPQSEAGLLDELERRWQVMQAGMERGMITALQPKFTLSGMPHGLAYRYVRHPLYGRLTGPLGAGIAAALALAEGNIAGVPICPAPTGGACAVVAPALQVAVAAFQPDRERLLRGLATAMVVEAVFIEQASVSGARHGCQAEIGVASAMAAGAVVEVATGDPRQVTQAVALALQGFLGLVCDPVGGFVIVPCIYRNTIAVSAALTAAELACTGIEFPIPADEVLAAMAAVGDQIPLICRESGQGGMAATPTAARMVATIPVSTGGVR